MSQIPAFLVRRVVGVAIAAAVFSAVSDRAYGGESKCTKQKGQVAQSGGSRAHVKSGSLYLCVPGWATKKIGPWDGGKIKMFGPEVVWTVRSVSDGGQTYDRVWAYGSGRTWLKGVLPTSGATAQTDTAVESLAVRSFMTGWVTTGGALVQATDAASVKKTEADYHLEIAPDIFQIGLDSPAGTGLLTKQGTAKRQVVGRWPAQAGPQLAKSLKIAIHDEGDADDCGGARSYGVTVEPLAGQPRVGWSTGFSWSYGNCP